jgi:hypothetical protein
MRKFILTQQHYDMAPGTELDYVKQSMPEKNAIGYLMLIGRHADGSLREVPAHKTVPHKDNDVFPTTEGTK